MDREKAKELFEKYCKKLRISPQWDVKLEFVEDTDWRKTGILNLIALTEKLFYC